MLLVLQRFSSVSLISALLLCAGCAVQPGILAPRSGDEIVIAGQLVHTGVPVRLWIDPGGFDGYRAHRHDLPQQQAPRDKPDQVLRFGSMRRGLPEGLAGRIHTSGWTLPDVAEVIDTIVLHYDACGSSSRCFHILHDIRGLSCHFLLDVDGTIYQTLDVKERAWHAGVANDRSIGIEIAHFGAAATPEGADRYYTVEDGLARLDPSAVEGTSAEGTAGIPARDPLYSGEIHGQQLYQRDFTEAQYQALESLLITLCRTLQGIEPAVPRRLDGSVHDRLRLETEGQPVAGIVGHWHVGTHKVDPGPAFDWDRVENALHEAGLRPSPAAVPD
jgi:N-acetyl-anhydromuramyl-L-alanine amidase AmpD